MMNKASRHLTQLLLSSLLLLALILVFYLSRYLDMDDPAAIKPELQSNHYCNTVKECLARAGDASVTLNILPAALPTGQPLDITVELSGLVAQQVTMEFIGRDMPMGLMPFNLQQQSGQTYTGTGRITFCTSDSQMVWMAKLKIETRDAIHTVFFELDTGEASPEPVAILP